jgi:hypothetical protein
VTVTLHVWRIRRGTVPKALWSMAADRRRLRRTPGVRFAKLLGVTRGRTFTVRDFDATRWGLLAAWATRSAATAFEGSGIASRWRHIATEHWRADLVPLSATGRWSRREPFGRPDKTGWDGPIAALTRARIAPRRVLRFWRAVPPVAADLRDRPGLRLAIGVGEAPLGVQGTFSVWDSSDALSDFAYGRTPHQTAIRRTNQERWYAEQLFARFAVLGSVGTLAGENPLQ